MVSNLNPIMQTSLQTLIPSFLRHPVYLLFYIKIYLSLSNQHRMHHSAYRPIHSIKYTPPSQEPCHKFRSCCIGCMHRIDLYQKIYTSLYMVEQDACNSIDSYKRKYIQVYVKLNNKNIYKQLGNQELPRLLIVTLAVYPHLDYFTRKLNFHYLNQPTPLRI